MSATTWTKDRSLDFSIEALFAAMLRGLHEGDHEIRDKDENKISGHILSIAKDADQALVCNELEGLDAIENLFVTLAAELANRYKTQAADEGMPCPLMVKMACLTLIGMDEDVPTPTLIDYMRYSLIPFSDIDAQVDEIIAGNTSNIYRSATDAKTFREPQMMTRRARQAIADHINDMDFVVDDDGLDETADHNIDT